MLALLLAYNSRICLEDALVVAVAQIITGFTGSAEMVSVQSSSISIS